MNTEPISSFRRQAAACRRSPAPGLVSACIAFLSCLAVRSSALTVIQDVTNDTTFTAAGSPYYVCRTSNRDPIVYTGVTVTVESGVQILKGSGQVPQQLPE